MHPHVLLVDDDQMNRHLVSKYLESFGCTVDVGADGADTVNKMNPENCDLVFVVSIISHPEKRGADISSLSTEHHWAQAL